MPYTAQTPIRGTARGDPAAIHRWAVHQGAARPGALHEYLETVYRLAPSLGLNPDVVVAQSLHECTHRDTGRPWTSNPWTYGCNPAGIGVTSDAEWYVYDFETGERAARAHLLHLHLYATGDTVPTGFLASDDPRWAAALAAGYAGIATTLADLTNRWGIDDGYAAKVARWLTALEAAGLLTADPTPEDTMAVRFEKRIATNRLKDFALLRDRLAWFTIHENGNPSSSPFDEAGFVRNGGGSGKVMYHFAVGVEDGEPTIVQIFPLNKRGKHAGNAEGNAKSVAVEVSQAPPGATSTKTQEALRELLYMVYTHDPRIDWGDGDYQFSPDRTCGHKDWPGANPGCPATMTRLWGGVSPVVQAVRKLLETTAPKPQYAKPLPIPNLPTDLPPTLVPFDGSDFVFVNRMVRATRKTPRLQKAYAGSPRLNVDIEPGETFMVNWLFRADDGNWYYVTPHWTRVRYEDTEPVEPEREAA